jgi:hypothetical protein
MKRPRDDTHDVLLLLKQEWSGMSAEQKAEVQAFVNPEQVWGEVDNSNLRVDFHRQALSYLKALDMDCDHNNFQAWLVKDGDWKSERFQFVKIYVFHDRPNGNWLLGTYEEDDGSNYHFIGRGHVLDEHQEDSEASAPLISFLAREQYSAWVAKGYRPLTAEERIKYAKTFKVQDDQHDGEEYEEPEEDEDEDCEDEE